MKRFLVLLLLALSLIIVLPALADPGSGLVSFDEDSYFYQISSGTLGTGYSGQGVDRTVTYNSGTTRSTANASVLIPVNCEISSVTFWVRDEHPGNHFLGMYFYDDTLTQTGFVSTLASETNWTFKTLTPLGGPYDTAYVKITLAQTSAINTVAASYSQVMKLDEITVYCDDVPPDDDDLEPDGGGDWDGGAILGGENLIRPLAEEDEDSEWAMFESESTDPEQQYTQVAFSNDIGDFVFAAADGMVTSVEELTESDCDLRLSADPISTCELTVPDSVTDDGEYLYNLHVNEGETIYKVVIAASGYDLEYFVANAPEYISVGDDISAGCYLGETFEVHDQSVGSIGNLEKGVTVATAISQISDEPVPLPMALYAIPENACNADPAFSSCIGDSNLSHEEQWSTSGSVLWQNPGALLGNNARIQQTLNLNETQQASLTVGARIISFAGGTANLRIQLGETIENTPVNFDTRLNELREYEIPLDLHDPDAGLFYTVAVAAAGNFQVEVVYACVTQGDSEAPKPSSSCYFANSSFDYGTTDWTTSGTVIAGVGDVTLTLGSYISQEVHLFPNENDSPHTYSVDITYQAVFTDPPDYDGIEYTMQYKYPASEDWVDAGPVDITTPTIYGHSFQFEVDEETTSAFALRANITAGNSTFIGVRLLQFCIRPPFPQQNDYGTDWFFTYTCSFISKPVNTEDLSAWTQWHWLNLNQFFQCDLMVLLHRLENSINSFFTTILWAIRYWMSMLFHGSDWLTTDFFPYLSGHFYNMAIGQTTFITTGDESCGNIFCLFTDIFSTGGSIFSDLIDGVSGLLSQLVSEILAPIVGTLLGIINQAVGLLLGIVTGIVSLAFSLLNLVFGFFNTMMDLVGIIADAWNGATPTPVPGLPACQLDPQSNGLCIGFWMMEHTIFSGTGALLIPLLIGYASIMLILWAIGTFKKTVTDTAAAI